MEKSAHVNTNPGFSERVLKEMKRLKRMVGYRLDLDEGVYLLSKEIEDYRHTIEELNAFCSQYSHINMQFKNEIDGLKAENEYLHERLKEETESNYLQSESIAPAINISIDSIHITNYPELFFRED